MPEWNFITNHGLVLSYISKHPRSTGREIAEAVGITERAIRNIITDLATEGFIIRRRQGRRNRYRINPGLGLHHPGHGEVLVGDLLKVLGWKGPQQRHRVDRTSSLQTALWEDKSPGDNPEEEGQE